MIAREEVERQVTVHVEKAGQECSVSEIDRLRIGPVALPD